MIFISQKKTAWTVRTIDSRDGREEADEVIRDRNDIVSKEKGRQKRPKKRERT